MLMPSIEKTILYFNNSYIIMSTSYIYIYIYIDDSLSNSLLEAFQWFCHSIKICCLWLVFRHLKLDYSWSHLPLYTTKRKKFQAFILMVKKHQMAHLSLQSFYCQVWYHTLPLKGFNPNYSTINHISRTIWHYFPFEFVKLLLEFKHRY